MRWIVWIVVLTAIAARGDVPATLPSTQPIAEFAADSPTRTWFNNLASPDETKREDARTQLMGLTRDDLPKLRELVIRSQPLAPEQAAALHDIVVQVWLTGEPYTQDNSKGFLGLLWPDMVYEDSRRIGVPVTNRLPGFPSFQMLRDGDLVTGVFVIPDASLQQLPNGPTPTRTLLIEAVGRASANRNVVLEILRQGQIIRVPMHLAAKPALPDQSRPEVEAFFSKRWQKGEDYWRQEFAPLVLPGMS